MVDEDDNDDGVIAHFPGLSAAAHKKRRLHRKNPQTGRSYAEKQSSKRRRVSLHWRLGLAALMGINANTADGKEPIDDTARKAMGIALQLMKELPSVAGKTAQIELLIYQQARHWALAGYYQTLAVEVGQGSEKGVAYVDRAGKDGARAEHLAVTVREMVRVLQSKQSAAPGNLARFKLAAVK